MQEPESRSRPLHAGCRRGSKQVAPRLILGPHTFSWFRHRLKHFDASTRVRFHSPSRSAPDAVSAASFPRRSPPRLLTGAAHGGLLPPPARRQRRACLHLSHSIASQQTAPTRPAGYRSGHTKAAVFFRNSPSAAGGSLPRVRSRAHAPPGKQAGPARDDPAATRSVGSPGGISPPGSHRTEREPLGSLRSSHLSHWNVPVHCQCANMGRFLRSRSSHHRFARLNGASRRYFFRAQRTR
jgi:hypothetical protein